MFGSLAVDGLKRFASYRHTCQEDTYVQSSTRCSTLVYARTHTLSPFKVNKQLCQGIIKLTDVLEVCAEAFTKRRKMGASKESERRTFQRSMSTMCHSALTSPLAPRLGLPLFAAPKALHSRFGAPPNSSFCWSKSARLVRRRGLKRSEWMLQLAAVWPQLSVRRDRIRRDRTAKHKINGKSIFRKSQEYSGCLTSAA